MIYVLFVKKKNTQWSRCFYSVPTHVITFNSGKTFTPGGQKAQTKTVNLADSILFYGLIQPCKYQQVLSLAPLIAKFFTYECNLAEEPLRFSSCLTYENVMIERYIAIKNKPAKLFNDKWHSFYNKKYYFIHLICPPLPHLIAIIQCYNNLTAFFFCKVYFVFNSFTLLLRLQFFSNQCNYVVNF